MITFPSDAKMAKFVSVLGFRQEVSVLACLDKRKLSLTAFCSYWISVTELNISVSEFAITEEVLKERFKIIGVDATLYKSFLNRSVTEPFSNKR